MRLPFMTDGDIVILVFFFAVLSRIWSVAIQSTCQNRIKVFTVFSLIPFEIMAIIRGKWDHTMVFRIQIKSCTVQIYAYCIIIWSIIHDSLAWIRLLDGLENTAAVKQQTTKGQNNEEKKNNTFVEWFSFVMCTVSSSPRRSLELLC